MGGADHPGAGVLAAHHREILSATSLRRSRDRGPADHDRRHVLGCSERDEWGQHSWGHCKFHAFDRGTFWVLPSTYLFVFPKAPGRTFPPNLSRFSLLLQRPPQCCDPIFLCLIFCTTLQYITLFYRRPRQGATLAANIVTRIAKVPYPSLVHWSRDFDAEQ